MFSEEIYVLRLIVHIYIYKYKYLLYNKHTNLSNYLN
jgi:hypothetical protein